MRTLFLLPIALLMPALAGCAGSSGPGHATTATKTGASAAATTPPGASVAPKTSGGTSPAAASCAGAPAAVVGASLGDTVKVLDATPNGATIVVCRYIGPKVGAVVLRIQTDQTPTGFAITKKGFATQGEKTKDEPGFMDAAYSSQITGRFPITTLVALKGHVEILVSANAPIAREKVLESTLFGKLG